MKKVTHLQEENLKIVIFDKLNAELVAKNEQLEKLVQESENKLSDLSQFNEESEVRIQNLYQQLEELESSNKRLEQDKLNLHEQIKTIKSEAERVINERTLYIKTLSDNSEDLTKKLKQSHQKIVNLQSDNEALVKKMKEYDNIKNLEFAQYSKEFENKELKMRMEFETMRDKCKKYENTVQELEINIRILDDEKSELRRQMIEYENQIDELEQQFRNRFEIELDEFRQKSVEFELKYNDQVKQNQDLIHKYDKTYQAMVQSELKSKETIFNLNSENAQLKQDIGKTELKLREMEKQKDKHFQEGYELQKKLCDALEEKNNYLNKVKELSTKKTVEAKPESDQEVTALKADLAKLQKERKAYKEEHSQNKKLKLQMTKLEETIKELESTNDFLSRQVNNLNDHIYELSNKENEETSENITTPMSRKSLSRKSLGNKRLLEIQNDAGLNTFNTPEPKAKQSDAQTEPNENAPMTPSSARRLNQCAQQ